MASTEITYIYCSLSLYIAQFVAVSLTDCLFLPFIFSPLMYMCACVHVEGMHACVCVFMLVCVHERDSYMCIYMYVVCLYILFMLCICVYVCCV